MKAKSHQEQAAAVDAIRLMQHPEVDLILASSLSAPHSNVQVAALDALAVRPPSDALATALAQAGRADRKPEVRLKAVRLMGQWLPDRPELRADLQRLATEGEPTKIREAARLALGS